MCMIESTRFIQQQLQLMTQKKRGQLPRRQWQRSPISAAELNCLQDTNRSCFLTKTSQFHHHSYTQDSNRGNDTSYDVILEGAPTSRLLVLFWRNTSLWCAPPFWRKEGLVMPPFRSRQPSFKCISARGGREVNGKASKSPISPIHSVQEGVDLSPHRSCT